MCAGSSNTLRMCDPTAKFLELPPAENGRL